MVPLILKAEVKVTAQQGNGEQSDSHTYKHKHTHTPDCQTNEAVAFLCPVSREHYWSVAQAHSSVQLSKNTIKGELEIIYTHKQPSLLFSLPKPEQTEHPSVPT